ncbi:hypothetical protein ACKWTF_001163 [Chironomus riparius]
MNESFKKLLNFLLLLVNSINVKCVRDSEETTRNYYKPQIHFNIHNDYGNTFGANGLKPNTYIAKNYFFESLPPLGPGPLAKALFSDGYEWAFSGPYDTLNNKRWNTIEDRRWRETTHAPYFQNKVPGEDKIIPASVVVGAATAFGLVSLLPLAVTHHKPLMYCGDTNLNQLAIRINNKNIYVCNEHNFEIACPDNFQNQLNYQCMNKKIQCDLKYDEIEANVYCRNETLFSKTNIFCTSTTNIAGRIETLSILECNEGDIPDNLSSFIPTTTPSPYTITTTTTTKPLSFGAKAHVFMLKLIGRFDVLEDETSPNVNSISSFRPWYPEPLKTPDIDWMRTISYPNNITRYEPLPKKLIEVAEKTPASEIPKNWVKVLKIE